MDLAREIAARCFGIERGELVVGGVPVGALAARYGTPLFVYAAGVLDRQLDRLREALPPGFSISYSVKANPGQAILRRFVARGCGLEVASAGELHQALAAGCPAERIVFAGPGKTVAELELALTRGIAEIHVESILEIERVAGLCRRLGLIGRVAVRVNPSGEAEGGAMRMGGRATPFGIDEEALPGALDRILEEGVLDFQGIHLFTGTQILEADVLLRQYRKGVEIARAAAVRTGSPLRSLDFGGGLGIPYFAGERELDLGALRRGLDALVGGVRADPLLAPARLMIEPGRFLVGSAGIYVTRINDIKVSRGRKFLIVDGGMHHHLAASGNLGQVVRRNFPIALLERLDAPVVEAVDVVGPLCTPLDTLARGAALPRAEVGELVGLFQSGAYARTASPLGFLSHPTPPEVWVEEGRDVPVRRRGSLDACLDDQVPLPAEPIAPAPPPVPIG